MAEILTVCPSNCGVTGPGVYRAESHPMSCAWMMEDSSRCMQHDEILRPDEETCPFPETSDEDPDPHRRLVVTA